MRRISWLALVALGVAVLTFNLSAPGALAGSGGLAWIDVPLEAVPEETVVPPGFSDAAIVATNSVEIKTGSTVSGDVAVNQPSSGATLVAGFDLVLARNATVHGDLTSQSMELNQRSTVNGDLFVDFLTNKGANHFGSVNPYPTPPVFDPFPAFELASVRATAANVAVGVGQTVILAAGEYGDITIAGLGTLILSGGVYDVRSLIGASTASVKLDAASDVRIEGRFEMGQSSFVGPSAGSGITARNVVLYVGAANGGDGSANAVPAAVKVGQASTLSANLYAPNGTIQIDRNGIVTGALLGRDVRIERDSSVTVDSFFRNLPPTANPATAFTNGAATITILLTGSDPENESLTFSIETGPTAGTLSNLTPIVPAPIEDPNNPGTFFQPPTVSATVDYSPTDPSANATDSFVFKVTDPAGGMGTATVTINPGACDDGSAPPCDPGVEPTAIDALDVTRETSTDVAVNVPLAAVAPSGVTLTFAVLTLPAGSLTDSGGNAIETVPFVLPSPLVNYTPPAGFTGSDSFQFEASGTVGGLPQSDTATATVNVAAQAELAPDQEVTTPLNQPLQVTLIGNPGGSGSPGSGLRSIVGKASLPGATVAGNVSDANGDGLGDGRDSLPGPAPVLVAAGVDVNLGATPSGSVTDPAGDATNSTADDPANPDLVSASVSSDGTNLNLQIRFVASGFSSATSRGSFVIDIDENPATGFPGVDAANNDSALMGVEFLVNIGANLGASAEVLKFISLPNSFSNVGSFPATVLADGYDVSIPLATLDGDDGRLTFKAETQSFLGPGFTGILDYMPNLGLAPGQSRTGIQGVARIQVEWDVSTLNIVSSDQIESATVTLSTQKGTVDALDTFWFEGTAEQDGLLQVSDYQAPAASLPGVVMPVPAGPTGTQGTFSFNTTLALRRAIDRGQDFFSVQGRVDESLAGQGFQRGLQVRSSATGNLSAGLEPQLVVITSEPTGPGLVFRIETLPSFGSLTTLLGIPVTVGQTFSVAPTLLYTPVFNFSGNDSFSYRVTQGVIVDTAIVGIFVDPNDQCIINGRDPGCSPGGN